MSANECWLLFSVCHFTFQYRRIDVIFFKSCNPLKDRPKVKLHQSTVTMALLQKPTRSEMRVPSTLFLFCCCFPLALPCLSHIFRKDEHRPLCPLSILQQTIECFFKTIYGDLFTFPWDEDHPHQSSNLLNMFVETLLWIFLLFPLRLQIGNFFPPLD